MKTDTTPATTQSVKVVAPTSTQQLRPTAESHQAAQANANQNVVGVDSGAQNGEVAHVNGVDQT